jgi:hypothetical protein
VCNVHIGSLNFVIFGGIYPVILFCIAKNINKLNCIVKQILDYCINGLNVDVLILFCPCKLTKFILISDQSLGRYLCKLCDLKFLLSQFVQRQSQYTLIVPLAA